MTAPPKFPLPFADRQPTFVPRSIDPAVPMAYYPAWGGAPGARRAARSAKRIIIVAAFIGLCVGAALYGALGK